MRRMVSDEILDDLAKAYSPEEILDILEIDSLELLHTLYDKVCEKINDFELRPVDCDGF